MPTTSQHYRGEATRGASRNTAVRVELTRVQYPLEVSRLNQQNQLKRTANKPTKSNKHTKTNKNDKPNKKPVVRLTNKQRIDSKLLNLTLDVNALQEELRSLAFYRTILQSRVLFKPQAADGSIVLSAQRYFHIFRRGYRVTEAQTQHDYLKAFVDDSCVLTSCSWTQNIEGLSPMGVGFTSLYEQWKQYNYCEFRFLSPPTFTVVSADSDETCVVRCETATHASFTWQAITLMFPAVMNDPQLLQRLLGREMVTPLCLHLHFDRQGRMVRHDFETDIFSALVYALKDPVTAAQIIATTEGPTVEILEEPEAVDTKASGLSGCEGEEQETQELTTASDERHSVTYLLS